MWIQHVMRLVVVPIKVKLFGLHIQNPVYDQLFVNPIANNPQVKYAIHNMNGRHIKSGNLDMQLGYAVIDMTALPKGFYTISFRSGEIRETKKIMKA